MIKVLPKTGEVGTKNRECLHKAVIIMHHISPYIIILLSSLTTFSLSSEDCLYQGSVVDISNYRADISWTYDCDQSLVQGFKIYYDHVRFTVLVVKRSDFDYGGEKLVTETIEIEV